MTTLHDSDGVVGSAGLLEAAHWAAQTNISIEVDAKISFAFSGSDQTWNMLHHLIGCAESWPGSYFSEHFLGEVVL